MTRSGLLIRAYIAGLGVVALSLALFFLAMSPVPSRTDFAISCVFVVFVTIAFRYPIHFDVKSSVMLDTGVIFASVLLFEPGHAMVIVLLGALAGNLSRRFEIEELTFNISQSTLQAGAAGMVLSAIGWNFGTLDFANGMVLASIALAAGAIYLTNTILVSIVIGLHTGMSPFQLWLQSVTKHDGMEQTGQFTIGILGAIVATAQPWALPILIVPAFIIGLSLARENELRERTILSVQRLADLVDVRDPYTASHSRRVAGIAREIATHMKLDPDAIALIERSGHVHDVGKIMIDLGLLSKPERLTDEEWRIFQQHPITGVQVLELFPDFADGIALVRSHHERMDGHGYPDGLSGKAIPLGARILAVADSFDAMASPRPYRDALPSDVVLAELRGGRGTQWDAEVVDALLNLIQAGRIMVGDANERPYIVDTIGYQEPLEFDAA